LAIGCDGEGIDPSPDDEAVGAEALADGDEQSRRQTRRLSVGVLEIANQPRRSGLSDAMTSSKAPLLRLVRARFLSRNPMRLFLSLGFSPAAVAGRLLINERFQERDNAATRAAHCRAIRKHTRRAYERRFDSEPVHDTNLHAPCIRPWVREW